MLLTSYILSLQGILMSYQETRPGLLFALLHLFPLLRNDDGAHDVVHLIDCKMKAKARKLAHLVREQSVVNCNGITHAWLMHVHVTNTRTSLCMCRTCLTLHTFHVLSIPPLPKAHACCWTRLLAAACMQLLHQWLTGPRHKRTAACR